MTPRVIIADNKEYLLMQDKKSYLNLDLQLRLFDLNILIFSKITFLKTSKSIMVKLILEQFFFLKKWRIKSDVLFI